MKFPFLEAKVKLVRIMDTFGLATGHGDTSQERVDENKKQRHEQEPVAWMYQDKISHAVKFQKHMSDFVDHSRWYETPLYTSPPQRQPLTDDVADELVMRFARYELLRAVEAAHGIKGAA